MFPVKKRGHNGCAKEPAPPPSCSSLSKPRLSPASLPVFVCMFLSLSLSLSLSSLSLARMKVKYPYHTSPSGTVHARPKVPTTEKMDRQENGERHQRRVCPASRTPMSTPSDSSPADQSVRRPLARRGPPPPPPFLSLALVKDGASPPPPPILRRLHDPDWRWSRRGVSVGSREASPAGRSVGRSVAHSPGILQDSPDQGIV
ncbi:hypothetical protein LY76DRAFT_130804 [Colletotrichum caudatum]|nr:hypothetical protein LY76DRAFT_130804 [Colletotrichum caudatum]